MTDKDRGRDIVTQFVGEERERERWERKGKSGRKREDVRDQREGGKEKWTWRGREREVKEIHREIKVERERQREREMEREGERIEGGKRYIRREEEENGKIEIQMEVEEREEERDGDRQGQRDRFIDME